MNATASEISARANCCRQGGSSLCCLDLEPHSLVGLAFVVKFSAQHTTGARRLAIGLQRFIHHAEAVVFAQIATKSILKKTPRQSAWLRRPGMRASSVAANSELPDHASRQAVDTCSAAVDRQANVPSAWRSITRRLNWPLSSWAQRAVKRAPRRWLSVVQL